MKLACLFDTLMPSKLSPLTYKLSKSLLMLVVKIFLNVDNISFIEIWNTNMRNKANAILDAISEVEIERLDKKTLHEIMMEKANEKNSKINDSDKIKLDDIIKEFLAMEQVRANDVLYVCDELSNDKIFFINEFEKFLKALDLGDGRNKYIYDMVCEELENNFLKFNFLFNCWFDDMGLAAVEKMLLKGFHINTTPLLN